MLDQIKQFVLDWGWIVTPVSAFLIGWIVWTAKKTFVTQDEYSKDGKANEEKHAEHTRRIDKVERDLEQRPTFQDFRKIEGQLSETVAAQREATATMQGVQQLMKAQNTQLQMVIENELRKERSA